VHFCLIIFKIFRPAHAGYNVVNIFIGYAGAYLQLGPFVQKKRDYFQQLMSATPFKPLASKGSYFQCYRYGGLSKESDKDFTIRLTKEFGVTAIPVSAFYHDEKDDKVIRFCFCKKEETLERAVERLMKFKG
jgi:methionine aminotransferase